MVWAIGNDKDPNHGVSGEFTPGSATKMLPLVRRIAEDMLRLTVSIEAQREQIRGIDRLPETIDHADYQEELSDIRESLQEDEERLSDCVRELSSLGLKVHSPFDGSIDFPAVLNRRRVQLCWVPEDDTVNYWHEVGQSRDQRQKIETQQFGVSSCN